VAASPPSPDPHMMATLGLRRLVGSRSLKKAAVSWYISIVVPSIVKEESVRLRIMVGEVNSLGI
jgi:hypothetical protein